MFGFNKIESQALLGAAFRVSFTVQVDAIEEGVRLTFSTSENANALLQSLQSAGVSARQTENSVLVPYDSIEGEFLD